MSRVEIAGDGVQQSEDCQKFGRTADDCVSGSPTDPVTSNLDVTESLSALCTHLYSQPSSCSCLSVWGSVMGQPVLAYLQGNIT